jgi:hypothetical protein
MDKKYAAEKAVQLELTAEMGESLWEKSLAAERSNGLAAVVEKFNDLLAEAVETKESLLTEGSVAYEQAMRRLRLLRPADVFLIVKMLTEPFENWPAYDLGIIDKNGRILKRPESSEELDALPPMAALVLNLKKDLVPAKAKMNWSSYPTAWNRVFMLRNIREELETDETTIEEDMGGLTAAAVQGPAMPFMNTNPTRRTKPK